MIPSIDTEGDIAFFGNYDTPRIQRR